MEPHNLSRNQFLHLATWFQGGLIVVALALAWLFDVSLPALCVLDRDAVVRGVLLTLPMLALFFLLMKIDWEPLRAIRKFLTGQLGPVFARCTVLDLVYVSFLAGLSEELLFRGSIQHSLGDGTTLSGLVIANVLFGFCHAYSSSYMVLAMIAGFYLSWVAGLERANLTSAIIAHTLYDLVALFTVRQLAIAEAEKEPDLEATSENRDSLDSTGRENAQNGVSGEQEE